MPDSLYYTSVEISQTDANTAYVTMAQFSAGNKVFRTINAGATWQNISYNLPNIPVNCVKALPGSDKIIIATDIGVYMLDSASATWTSISLGLPNVIVQDIEFNVALNKLYVCTFGRGIWETDLNAITHSTTVANTQMDIELYPAINNGSFTINMSSNYPEPFRLEIIDIKGRKVKSASLSGEKTYQFQVDLSPGMYFARLTGNNLSGVKSFVVQ